MTLPINVTLPLNEQMINSKDPGQLYAYMKKLVYVLGTQIQQTNQTVNGSLTAIDLNNNPTYPFIVGSTPAMSPTTTYTDPIIWIRRSNLLIQVWFDITWANNSDAGNLWINLPYESQPSIGSPYIGVIESDNMTFTSGYTYLTGNILQGTNTIEIHQNGSGEPVIALPVTAAGHLRGSIQYVGQQFN